MSAPEGTSQIIYRLVVWYSPGWQMGWYRECATFTQLQFPHQRQPGNNGCTKGPADLRKSVGAMTHSLVWQLVTNVVGDFEVAQGNWHGGDRSWHFRAPVLMVVQAALTKSQRVVEQCWTCMNMLQPWSYPMILKHYVFDKFDMCNFRINFTVPRDKSRGHPLHKAPRHRNFVQRLHLDPTGLMKARLAVLVPGKSIPWIWIWSLQLRFSSNSAVFLKTFDQFVFNLLGPFEAARFKHTEVLRHARRGGRTWSCVLVVFPAKPPILQSFVRWLLASCFVTIFVFPGDRWVFLLRLGNHQPTIRRYFLGPSRWNPCGWGMRNVRTSQIQVGPSWEGKWWIGHLEKSQPLWW